MKENQKKYVILGSLCALVLMLAVGYAAFNAILNIKGTTSINSNWDVKITGIEKMESKGTTDKEGTPKYDNLSATFNTDFTTPGDYATYKIEITNNGSMDAVLKNITMPENTNNDIIFYLNKNQNNEDIVGSLKQNDTLFKKGETGNVGYVYVTVLYRDYENQQTAENKTANMTITFDFEQADGNATPTPQLTTVYRHTTDALHIGDSIEGIETVTDPSTLDKNYYLKHEIDSENKVTATYACFVTDKEFCIQGGSSNYYETNKTNLLSMFGESSCNIRDSSIYCNVGSFSVSADSDGPVYVYHNNRVCSVLIDSNSGCGAM